MSTFDESQHDRDPSGRFTEMAGAEQSDSLGAATTVLPRPAMTDEEIEEAASAAVVATLWISNEIEEAEADRGERIDADPSVHAYLRTEIADFVGAYPELIEEARATGYTATDGSGFEGAFGHDFVLTREHCGAGFWDRPDLHQNDIGRRIADVVQHRGEGDTLFVGDDGTALFEFGKCHTTMRAESAEKLRDLRAAADQDGTSYADTDWKHRLNHLYAHLSYADRRWVDENGAR